MACILVVDDSWFQRMSLRNLLEAEGYEILEAENGKRALEIAAARRPDCILLDLVMPEMDGMAVLQNLRARHSALPVIVLTADIQDSTRDACLEMGVQAVLHKPLPAGDKLLPRLVAQILAQPGP